MSLYTVNQVFKDVLWGTPMPVTARLDGNFTQLIFKGACTLVVTDALLLEKNLSQSESLINVIRRIMVSSLIEAVIALTDVKSFDELVSKKDELATAQKMEANQALSQIGMSVEKIEFHAIELA